MRNGILMGAALAAVVAGAASANIVVDLGDNTLIGGASSSVVTYGIGELTGINIEFDFVDVPGGSAAWASDLILQIIDPNGNAIFWGGFNVNPGGTNLGAWAFDGAASTNSGFYEDKKFLSTPLAGDGDWTVKIFHGWTAGPEVQYNNVLVTLKGLEIPAPGAFALLGVAGLLGSRRRRA